MARARYNHNTFSTGVISKKTQGNTDFQGYNDALDVCENFQVMHTGGVIKRPGTFYMAPTKNSGKVRLIPFVYSSDNSYVLEFGVNYIRFFDMDGVVMSGDAPLEIVTTFTADDLDKLRFFQSGLSLYLNTPKGMFMIILKSETGEFNMYGPMVFTVPPATFPNEEEIALKPSGVSGTITITAVNPTNIAQKPNSKFAPLFYPEDVGGYVILTYTLTSNQKRSYYVKIETVTQDGATAFNKVTGTINAEYSFYNDSAEDGHKNDLPSDNAIRRWQISALNASRGYPKAIATFEGRMFLGNNSASRIGVWGSSLMYDDFYDFIVGERDADAVQIKATMDKSDEILWIDSQSKLFFGTRGGIYIAGSAGYREDPITPSNFRVRLFDSVGSSPLQPVKALDTLFFVDSTNVNVHEIILNIENGLYQANDLSLISNDLTQTGIIDHTWQQTPIKTYWAAVKSGELCSLTYLKNNNILAWSNHKLGGRGVFVENLCTIPSTNGDYVWAVVRREINNQIVRYIEYLKMPFNPITDADFEQHYLDSCKIYEDKVAITNIIRSENAHIRSNLLNFRGAGVKDSYLLKFVYKSGEPTALTIQYNRPTVALAPKNIEPLTGLRSREHITMQIAVSRDQSAAVVAVINQIFTDQPQVWYTHNVAEMDDWKVVTLPAGKYIIGLTWVRGLESTAGEFFLIDEKGRVHSSQNGKDWSRSEQGIAGRNVFHIYGTNTHATIHSKIETCQLNIKDDLNNWTTNETNLPYVVGGYLGGALDGVVAEPLVALPKTAGNHIYTSADGLTWTQRGVTTCYYRDMISFGGWRLHIAVGDKISVSEDGITWEDVLDARAFGGLYKITGKESGGVNPSHPTFIATGRYATYICNDPVGKKWTRLYGEDEYFSEHHPERAETNAAYVNGNIYIPKYNSYNKKFKWSRYELLNYDAPSYNEFKAINITEHGFDLELSRLREDLTNKDTFSVDAYILITEGAKLRATVDPLPTPVKILCDATEIPDGTRVIFRGGLYDYAIDLEVNVNGKEVDYSDLIWITSGRDAEGFFIKHLDGTNPIVTRIEAGNDSNIVFFKYLGQIDGTYDEADPKNQTVYFGSSTKIQLAAGRWVEPYGKKVKIAKIIGQDIINGKTFSLVNATGQENNVFRLLGTDSTSWPLYDPKDGNGWVYFDIGSEYKEGLDHLIGQQVGVCINGNSDGKLLTVNSLGRIYMPGSATKNVFYMTVGIPYASRLKTVPFSGGSLFGSSVGVPGSQKDAIIKLYYSLGGKVGSEFDNMRMIPYKNIGARMDLPVPLYTGLAKVSIENAKDVYNRCICIEHDKPVSFNVLSITQDVIVSDA